MSLWPLHGKLAMQNPEIIIVIPARLSSTRLPRKMLLAETGKPLIQHTIEAAGRSTSAQAVVVGTEDPEIVAAVERFGGRAFLTQRHPTGTDRVAEVARRFPSARIVVNVQGDEPEIAPDHIDAAIEALKANPDAAMSTLAAPILDRERLDDPACVKVIFNGAGNALWFSRSPIPFARDSARNWLQHSPPVYFQHVGLYVYRAEFLQRIPSLPVSLAEQVESLEQLRVLAAGEKIQVVVIPEAHKGIDTLEDYRMFVRRAVTQPEIALKA